MEGFREGYKFFSSSAASTSAAFAGAGYVDRVVEEIEELTKNINEFNGIETAAKQLKGDVAEFWHSGTFNIDAAVKGSIQRTSVERMRTLASADITSSFGKSFGLKYYKDAASSAKQQAKSVFERFKEYGQKGGTDSFEEFLRKNKISEDAVLSDPLYSGQIRIVPADQLKEAVEWLRKKYQKESVIRPENAERYKETLDMLRDKIEDNKGNQSIPLTKEDAEILAEAAREGKFNPADWGLTTEELIKYRYILQQSLKAGMTSATISIVLRVAPEIVKAIQHLIQNGELDEKQFQKIGFAALSGGAEGFVRGSVAAGITAACKAGLLGEALKSVNPSVVGVITVITMDTMKNAFGVAAGKMTGRELANELVREMFISSCSLLMGGVVQGVMAQLPVVGYMIGSFVGSVVGSFVYSSGYNAVLSFCVDNGFTFFGLVEQDYTLPDEVMEQIGIEVFKYDRFEYPKFEYPRFEYPKFEYDHFEPPCIDIVFLRRGVIGVHKIGYV